VRRSAHTVVTPMKPGLRTSDSSRSERASLSYENLLCLHTRSIPNHPAATILIVACFAFRLPRWHFVLSKRAGTGRQSVCLCLFYS
jgi:hypothetical protein